MILRDSRAPDDKVPRLILLSLDRLGSALRLESLELDAVASLHRNRYYQEAGFVDCGPPFREDEEELVPMRKVLGRV